MSEKLIGVGYSEQVRAREHSAGGEQQPEHQVAELTVVEAAVAFEAEPDAQDRQSPGCGSATSPLLKRRSTSRHFSSIGRIMRRPSSLTKNP